MKHCIIVALLGIALNPGTASAQSIGVFADPFCASCVVDMPSSFAMIFVNIVGATGVTGAEFRVDGLPAYPLWTVDQILADNVSNHHGNAHEGGMWVGFDSCQTGPCITLLRFQVLAHQTVNDLVLTVNMHGNASVSFPCPLVTICDAPVFTKMCVAGGQAFVNSTGPECTVAVEATTWSSVKAMYVD